MRVEAVAARAGVSVDTVRYYQARGLLHAPRRAGRFAWYDDSHVDRLQRIRSMQASGFSLASIARVLDGSLDAADVALVGALSGREEPGARSGPPAAPTSEAPRLMSVSELAERTGIPVPVLQAVVAEGLLVPRRIGDSSGYTDEDVAAAEAGLALLGWGIPLSDLLALASSHHRAMQEVAEQAVALFDTHVRHKLRHDPSADAAEAALQLVDAYRTLVPAASTLVSHHFTRVLLSCALDHIERSTAGSVTDPEPVVAGASARPVSPPGAVPPR